MVHPPGFLHISLWECMARGPTPSSYYYIAVKYMKGNSQQCSCLSDYWLSSLTSPPLFTSPVTAPSHSWANRRLVFSAIPRFQPQRSPEQTNTEFLRQVLVSSTSFMYPDRQIHFIDRQWHIWILRGETSVGAYCIDLHLFFHVEEDIVKTSIGFHMTAMSWWL